MQRKKLIPIPREILRNFMLWSPSQFGMLKFAELSSVFFFCWHWTSLMKRFECCYNSKSRGLVHLVFADESFDECVSFCWYKYLYRGSIHRRHTFHIADLNFKQPYHSFISASLETEFQTESRNCSTRFLIDCIGQYMWLMLSDWIHTNCCSLSFK